MLLRHFGFCPHSLEGLNRATLSRIRLFPCNTDSLVLSSRPQISDPCRGFGSSAPRLTLRTLPSFLGGAEICNPCRGFGSSQATLTRWCFPPGLKSVRSVEDSVRRIQRLAGLLGWAAPGVRLGCDWTLPGLCLGCAWAMLGLCLGCAWVAMGLPP